MHYFCVLSITLECNRATLFKNLSSFLKKLTHIMIVQALTFILQIRTSRFYKVVPGYMAIKWQRKDSKPGVSE